jgi:hypothetical protein
MNNSKKRRLAAARRRVDRQGIENITHMEAVRGDRLLARHLFGGPKATETNRAERRR